jgi:anaerobic magnesium-protoporphyrin IX monomethyl ester cyclase
MDVLFVHPGNSLNIYQELAVDFAAIEPPTWSLLLAQSCRSAGYEVGILDTNAERLTDQQSIERILAVNPRLICFVVYGQNPNSGTTMMSGALRLAQEIKAQGLGQAICFVGSHISALPFEVLKNDCIDVILTNEGVYALRNLLAEDLSDISQLEHIKGIGFCENGVATLTEPEKIVPQERMDIDLPGYAWDLLPFKNKPFDLYRSHFWHGEYDHEKRSPFAAIYTSLGCMFRCDFCMINILNRNDNDPIGVASNYAQMRFWSPEFIICEFDKLVGMGVRTIRISDEMFLLNRKFYVPLCELLEARGYGKELRMWAYSRVDSVNPKYLQLLRNAGIKWLALGIESADLKVRLEVTKGKFKDVKIRDIVKMVHDADIEIIANYMFGLPGETLESMERTLKLSLDLCTIAWNGYTAMPLPGSQLFKEALEKAYPLPEDYEGYSFHSYNTSPLPTKNLPSTEILAFRDNAFLEYHRFPPFLQKVESKYGSLARRNIEEMAKIRLKRRLLGD